MLDVDGEPTKIVLIAGSLNLVGSALSTVNQVDHVSVRTLRMQPELHLPYALQLCVVRVRYKTIKKTNLVGKSLLM